MSLRISELAARLGARLENAKVDFVVDSLAMHDTAASRDVSFIPPVFAHRVVGHAAAGAMLVTTAAAHVNALVVGDVLQACARSAAWLPIRRSAEARTRRATNIASTAVVASDVWIGKGVWIGEHATVDSGAVLEDGVSIGAYGHIEAGVVIRHQALLGNRVRIGTGTCIGSEGFAFLNDGGTWHAMPSFGSVVIGDDVAILAHTVVHAGVLGDTYIAHGCVLDSQVLIGHDSVIGAHTAIAGQSAIAGAARIGRGCRIGGKVGIGEGVEVADGVTITAMSMVTRSITRVGARYSSGWPAEPSSTWWRRVADMRRSRS